MAWYVYLKVMGDMVQIAAWRLEGHASHGAFYEILNTKNILKWFYFIIKKSKAWQLFSLFS